MIDKIPLVTFILNNAERYGAQIIFEEKYKSVGRIEFPNGNVFFFFKNQIDINPLGSTAVARDKDYTNFFLGKLDYKTIESKIFFSSIWARRNRLNYKINEALEYAMQIGFPVFIKPNNSTQGKGVAEVLSSKDFKTFFKKAFKYDSNVLVQKSYSNYRDYRIVVFRDKVKLVYGKEPLSIVGNGKSNIKKIFEQKIKKEIEAGRDIKISFDDYRIKSRLKALKLKGKTIIEEGREIKLLSNANLTQGADGLDESMDISLEWQEWAVDLVKKMNLKLCGIDVLVEDDLKTSPDKTDYRLLELNPTPGFGHYMAISNDSRERAQKLFEEILKYLAK